MIRRASGGPVSARAVVLAMLLGLSLAAGGSALLLWSTGELANARSAHTLAVRAAGDRQTARVDKALKVAADRANSDRYAAQVAADAAADSAAAASGFSRGGEGVYYQLIDRACTASTCVHLEVMLRAACPAGVHVVGRLLRSSASIGAVEGSTAALATGESTILELAVPGDPDTIQITEAHCLG